MERVQIGNVEIVSIVDDHLTFPASQLYPEAGEALSQYSQFMDGDESITMVCACFLLRADGRTILVDTGNGAAGQARLLQELTTLGVTPGDIDDIVFTHIHPDHTAGNLSADGTAAVFPRARYWVPQADWDFFRAKDPVPEYVLRDVLPLESLQQIELFDGEHALSPAITFLPTPGHSPGHTAIAITSAGERGYCFGDIAIWPISIVEPAWRVVFDSHPDVAEATRREVMHLLASRGDLVAASHLGATGFGRFVTADEGLAWQSP